ncbi:MAG: SDR family NAD(P)-dependent oxidoreductase [Chthoniobacterales bacterium]
MSKRVAVITGGAGDLAHALAPALEKDGLEVHAPGRDLLNVTSPESVRAFFRELGTVDLLVNNAGMRADALCAQMTEAAWDAVMSANLRGAFLCSQVVGLTMMRQRSGHIINIGSFSARYGTSGQSNYAAAKAGLIGLTQTMARELGKRSVRVNCVLPGFLETKFTETMTGENKESARQMHELGKFNTVDDAARFIAFLDTMSAVSGQVFQLDSRVSPWT